MQVQFATSKITNLVHSLPHELVNDLKQKIRKPQIWMKIAQCPVTLPEIKLWQQHAQNTKKQISNFSSLAQFYRISIICSRYFLRGYRKGKYIVHYGDQRSLTHAINRKAFSQYRKLKQNLKQIQQILSPNFLTFNFYV